MAGCVSLFSLKMIRILLERDGIPFEIRPAAGAPSARDPVSRVAADTGATIVAMVDSFRELPKDLQGYLLSVGNVPRSSPDRVKGLVLGGRDRPAARAKTAKASRKKVIRAAPKS